jgi:3,4-dihydroxyphthalate decarboxylase
MTAVPDQSQVPELRDAVARACRILAMEGVADGVLGHVSVRIGDGRMLIRGRGPGEHGLLFTTIDDIRLVDFSGAGDDPAAGYAMANELPIHGETLRTRPQVNAVVHAHPPAATACGIAGLELRPIVGAYNIPAMRLAAGGIPVYPRSVLIRTPGLARDMLACMGDRPACVLRGHGVTVTGETLEQAVVRTLNIEALAAVTLAAAPGGHPAPDIPAEDIAELPDLGSAFNDQSVWRYYCAKAARAGLLQPLVEPDGKQLTEGRRIMSPAGSQRRQTGPQGNRPGRGRPYRASGGKSCPDERATFRRAIGPCRGGDDVRCRWLPPAPGRSWPVPGPSCRRRASRTR